MQNILLIINDGPYGNERPFNSFSSSASKWSTHGEPTPT